MIPELIKVEDAAKQLGVSGQTVRNLLRAGAIDGFKVGRNWRIINRPGWWRNLDNGHKDGV